MVESLQGLNRICQKPRYREVGNWMVRYILRDAALPITWLLLHTPVSANQVTTAALAVGLLGVGLLSFPSSLYFLTGTLCLQFWYLLDHVDGQIARYRKTATLSGRFYDFLMHHLIHGTLFFALGWHAYVKTGQVIFIFFGFVTTLAAMVFNFSYDIQYKTFFEQLMTLKSVRKNDDRLGDTAAPARTRSLPARLFSFLHKLIEMHVAMNLLTFTAILEIVFWKNISLRLILFGIYAATIPLVTVTKVVFWIHTGRIDREFRRLFKLTTDE